MCDIAVSKHPERVDVRRSHDVSFDVRDEPRDDRGELRVLALERMLDEPRIRRRVDPHRPTTHAKTFARQTVGDDRPKVFGPFAQARQRDGRRVLEAREELR